MQANSSAKLDAQHALLLDYLRQVRYTNLATLLETDDFTLIKDCFEQFTIFLMDTAPLEVWHNAFVEYARSLMDWLYRPKWHADWVIRSMEFVSFAESLGVIQLEK